MSVEIPSETLAERGVLLALLARSAAMTKLSESCNSTAHACEVGGLAEHADYERGKADAYKICAASLKDLYNKALDASEMVASERA